jgi:Secretion system C-terminal sorting domain
MITVMTEKQYDDGFISIYNMIGQELIKQHVETYKTQIDISTLIPGNYLLKYISKNRVSINNFVKE